MKHDKALEERAKRAARSPAFIGLVAGSNDYGEILYKQGALDERAAIKGSLREARNIVAGISDTKGYGGLTHVVRSVSEASAALAILDELLKEGV